MKHISYQIAILACLILSGCKVVENQVQGSFGSTPSLTDYSPDKVYGSTATSALGGAALVMEADFDGDGVMDVVAGSVKDNSGVGAIYVYSGADMSLMYSVDGEAGVEASFGNIIYIVNDRDADGVKDILVNSGYLGPNYRLTLLSGADGSLLWRHTEAGAMWFGNVIYEAGDLNGDGVKDIFTYTMGYLYPQGGAWALSGADGTTLWLYTGAGWGSLSMITGLMPDWNADGKIDVLVHDDVNFLLLSGADGSVLRTCNPGVAFADPVVLGDVNSDGKSEVLLHDANANGQMGMASVYDVATCSEVFNRQGSFSMDRYGEQVAVVNDLTGDGIKDILVNQPDYNSLAGRVQAVDAATGAVLYNVDGTAPGMGFRAQYATMLQGSDYNGDGVDDWLGGTTSPQQVVVVSGSDGAILYTFAAEATPSQFGGKILLNTDFDGDGTKDIIIDDAKFDSDRGKVYFYSGADGSLIHSITGENVGDRFAIPWNSTKLFAPDINANGVADMVFTSSAYDSGRGAIYLYHKGWDY